MGEKRTSRPTPEKNILNGWHMRKPDVPFGHQRYCWRKTRIHADLSENQSAFTSSLSLSANRQTQPGRPSGLLFFWEFLLISIKPLSMLADNPANRLLLLEIEMTDSTIATQAYTQASGYWKLCTIILGIGFLIAVASHATPSQASANEPTNLLALHQAQAAAIKSADAQQKLAVGGFDAIEGQPVFVIINEQGQRVGTLPMSSMRPDEKAHANP